VYSVAFSKDTLVLTILFMACIGICRH
jgi:hypothetical protein